MLYTAAKVLSFLLSHAVGFNIPITNGGFETDDYPIPDNTFRYWTDVVITGWNAYDPNNIMERYTQGVFNPSTGDTYNDTIFGTGCPEGLQAGYIEPSEGRGEFGIEQELPGTVAVVGTTYILTTYVGNPGNNCWSEQSTESKVCTTSHELGFPGYKTVLLIGGTVIAEDNNTVNIPQKEWRLSTVQVTILPEDPNIGAGPLKIRLVNKNTDTDMGIQVDFDDVQLSAITTAPTLSPTLDPTVDPTIEPISDPTFMPTIDPTSDPTTEPTSLPTKPPTLFPSMKPVALSTEDDQSENEEKQVAKWDSWDNVGYGIISVLMFTPVLLLIFGLIYHCTKKGSDSPAYFAVIRCFTNVADFYTDTVFCVSLLMKRDDIIPSAIAAVFTFIPHICSIAICLKTLHKWRQMKAFKYYVEKYDALIIGITAIAGFYPAVDFLSSKLFHLKQTSLHLDQTEFFRLKQFRFVNNILLENVPLMAVQLYLIIQSTSIADVEPITILAFVFSSISLIVGLLTLVSRAFGNKSEKVRSLMFYKMDLKSKSFEPKHRFIHSIFAKTISRCLGIEENRVETVSIIPILNGITVTFNVKIDNEDEQKKLGGVLKEIISNVNPSTVDEDGVSDLKALLVKYLKVAHLNDLKVEITESIGIDIQNTTEMHLAETIESTE